MENRNVILIVVATVVIAAVGTFVITSSDEEPFEVGIKSEFEPGDFVEASMTQNGMQMDTRIVVLENLEDGRLSFAMYVNGIPRYMESEASMLEGRLSLTAGAYTGLEEIDRYTESTFMGMRECVLWTGMYDDFDATVLADAETAVVYSILLEKDGMTMTFDVKSTSFVNVFGPGEVPVLEDTVDGGPLEAGDYIQWLVSDYRGSTGTGKDVTYTADSVKDGVVAYSCNDGTAGTCTETEFRSMFIDTPKDGSYDSVKRTIADTSFGYRLCDVYYSGGDMVMTVGAGTGICYFERTVSGDTVTETEFFDTSLIGSLD